MVEKLASFLNRLEKLTLAKGLSLDPTGYNLAPPLQTPLERLRAYNAQIPTISKVSAPVPAAAVAPVEVPSSTTPLPASPHSGNAGVAKAPSSVHPSPGPTASGGHVVTIHGLRHGVEDTGSASTLSPSPSTASTFGAVPAIRHGHNPTHPQIASDLRQHHPVGGITPQHISGNRHNASTVGDLSAHIIHHPSSVSQPWSYEIKHSTTGRVVSKGSINSVMKQGAADEAHHALLDHHAKALHQYVQHHVDTVKQHAMHSTAPSAHVPPAAPHHAPSPASTPAPAPSTTPAPTSAHLPSGLPAFHKQVHFTGWGAPPHAAHSLSPTPPFVGPFAAHTDAGQMATTHPPTLAATPSLVNRHKWAVDRSTNSSVHMQYTSKGWELRLFDQNGKRTSDPVHKINGQGAQYANQVASMMLYNHVHGGSVHLPSGPAPSGAAGHALAQTHASALGAPASSTTPAPVNAPATPSVNPPSVTHISRTTVSAHPSTPALGWSPVQTGRSSTGRKTISSHPSGYTIRHDVNVASPHIHVVDPAGNNVASTPYYSTNDEHFLGHWANSNIPALQTYTSQAPSTAPSATSSPTRPSTVLGTSDLMPHGHRTPAPGWSANPTNFSPHIHYIHSLGHTIQFDPSSRTMNLIDPAGQNLASSSSGIKYPGGGNTHEALTHWANANIPALQAPAAQPTTPAGAPHLTAADIAPHSPSGHGAYAAGWTGNASARLNTGGVGTSTWATHPSGYEIQAKTSSGSQAGHHLIDPQGQQVAYLPPALNGIAPGAARRVLSHWANANVPALQSPSTPVNQPATPVVNSPTPAHQILTAADLQPHAQTGVGLPAMTPLHAVGWGDNSHLPAKNGIFPRMAHAASGYSLQMDSQTPTAHYHLMDPQGRSVASTPIDTMGRGNALHLRETMTHWANAHIPGIHTPAAAPPTSTQALTAAQLTPHINTAARMRGQGYLPGWILHPQVGQAGSTPGSQYNQLHRASGHTIQRSMDPTTGMITHHVVDPQGNVLAITPPGGFGGHTASAIQHGLARWADVNIPSLGHAASTMNPPATSGVNSPAPSAGYQPVSDSDLSAYQGYRTHAPGWTPSTASASYSGLQNLFTHTSGHTIDYDPQARVFHLVDPSGNVSHINTNSGNMRDPAQHLTHWANANVPALQASPSAPASNPPPVQALGIRDLMPHTNQGNQNAPAAGWSPHNSMTAQGTRQTAFIHPSGYSIQHDAGAQNSYVVDPQGNDVASRTAGALGYSGNLPLHHILTHWANANVPALGGTSAPMNSPATPASNPSPHQLTASDLAPHMQAAKNTGAPSGWAPPPSGFTPVPGQVNRLLEDQNPTTGHQLQWDSSNDNYYLVDHTGADIATMPTATTASGRIDQKAAMIHWLHASPHMPASAGNAPATPVVNSTPTLSSQDMAPHSSVTNHAPGWRAPGPGMLAAKPSTTLFAAHPQTGHQIVEDHVSLDHYLTDPHGNVLATLPHGTMNGMAASGSPSRALSHWANANVPQLGGTAPALNQPATTVGNMSAPSLQHSDLVPHLGNAQLAAGWRRPSSPYRGQNNHPTRMVLAEQPNGARNSIEGDTATGDHYVVNQFGHDIAHLPASVPASHGILAGDAQNALTHWVHAQMNPSATGMHTPQPAASPGPQQISDSDLASHDNQPTHAPGWTPAGGPGRMVRYTHPSGYSILHMPASHSYHLVDPNGNTTHEHQPTGVINNVAQSMTHYANANVPAVQQSSPAPQALHPTDLTQYNNQIRHRSGWTPAWNPRTPLNPAGSTDLFTHPSGHKVTYDLSRDRFHIVDPSGNETHYHDTHPAVANAGDALTHWASDNVPALGGTPQLAAMNPPATSVVNPPPPAPNSVGLLQSDVAPFLNHASPHPAWTSAGTLASNSNGMVPFYSHPSGAQIALDHNSGDLHILNSLGQSTHSIPSRAVGLPGSIIPAHTLTHWASANVPALGGTANASTTAPATSTGPVQHLTAADVAPHINGGHAMGWTFSTPQATGTGGHKQIMHNPRTGHEIVEAQSPGGPSLALVDPSGNGLAVIHSSQYGSHGNFATAQGLTHWAATNLPTLGGSSAVNTPAISSVNPSPASAAPAGPVPSGPYPATGPSPGPSLLIANAGFTPYTRQAQRSSSASGWSNRTQHVSGSAAPGRQIAYANTQTGHSIQSDYSTNTYHIVDAQGHDVAHMPMKSTSNQRWTQQQALTHWFNANQHRLPQITTLQPPRAVPNGTSLIPNHIQTALLNGLNRQAAPSGGWTQTTVPSLYPGSRHQITLAHPSGYEVTGYDTGYGGYSVGVWHNGTRIARHTATTNQWRTPTTYAQQIHARVNQIAHLVHNSATTTPALAVSTPSGGSSSSAASATAPTLAPAHNRGTRAPGALISSSSVTLQPGEEYVPPPARTDVNHRTMAEIYGGYNPQARVAARFQSKIDGNLVSRYTSDKSLLPNDWDTSQVTTDGLASYKNTRHGYEVEAQVIPPPPANMQANTPGPGDNYYTIVVRDSAGNTISTYDTQAARSPSYIQDRVTQVAGWVDEAHKNAQPTVAQATSQRGPDQFLNEVDHTTPIPPPSGSPPFSLDSKDWSTPANQAAILAHLKQEFPGNHGIRQNGPHGTLDPIQHTMRILEDENMHTEGLPERDKQLLRLAMVYHDVGKQHDAYDEEHPRKSVADATKVLWEHGLSPNEHADVRRLIKWHDAYGISAQKSSAGGGRPLSSSEAKVVAGKAGSDRMADLLLRAWQSDLKSIPGLSKSRPAGRGHSGHIDVDADGPGYLANVRAAAAGAWASDPRYDHDLKVHGPPFPTASTTTPAASRVPPGIKYGELVKTAKGQAHIGLPLGYDSTVVPPQEVYNEAHQNPDLNYARAFNMAYDGPTGHIVYIAHATDRSAVGPIAQTGAFPGGMISGTRSVNAYTKGLYASTNGLQHLQTSFGNHAVVMEYHTGKCAQEHQVAGIVSRWRSAVGPTSLTDSADIKTAALLWDGYHSHCIEYNGSPCIVVLDPARTRVVTITDKSGKAISHLAGGGPVVVNGKQVALPDLPPGCVRPSPGDLHHMPVNPQRSPIGWTGQARTS